MRDETAACMGERGGWVGGFLLQGRRRTTDVVRSEGAGNGCVCREGKEIFRCDWDTSSSASSTDAKNREVAGHIQGDRDDRSDRWRSEPGDCAD